jgi:acetate kinase
MFVSRAAAGIAAAATALPRLDALVFTGGIGEHSGSIRSAIVRRLAPLGLGSLPATDVRNDAVISSSGSAVAVLRIEAREDAVIAQQTAALLTKRRHSDAGRPRATRLS